MEHKYTSQPQTTGKLPTAGLGYLYQDRPLDMTFWTSQGISQLRASDPHMMSMILFIAKTYQ